MELDLAGVRPVEPMHAEIVAPELRTRATELSHRQHEDRAVTQEDQPAARPKQARRLRDPAVRVAPDARAVFGENQIEALLPEGNLFGVRFHQRKTETEALLHGSGGGELRRCDVDADGSRSTPGQPAREVPGPTPEIQDIQS